MDYQILDQFTYLYSPRFKTLLSKLSKSALVRILISLENHQINPDNYSDKDPLEKEAFVLGYKLIEGKYVKQFLTNFEEMVKSNNQEEKKEEENGKV